jgi:hypothetical protein
MNGFDSRQRQGFLLSPLLPFRFWGSLVVYIKRIPAIGARVLEAEHLRAYRTGVTSDMEEQYSNVIRKARATRK